jgi:hypothetical protein
VLPRQFGPRFLFDSALLDELCEPWRKVGIHFPGSMVIPAPGGSWGWANVPVPTPERTRNIDLVVVTGGENLRGVDLLAYPWVCHELGHALLHRYRAEFLGPFEHVLGEHVAAATRRSLPDVGLAKDRARRTTDRLLRFWAPASDQKDWAHELAIDLIALWTCGPAFLACAEDAFAREGLNPFLITESHPPYAVRAAALADAAIELGWGSEVAGLVELLDGWRRSEWAEQRDSAYPTLADQRLIDACRGAAIAGCRSARLQTCTRATVTRAEQSVDAGELPDWGADLMLAAWAAYRRLGDDGFPEWQAHTVRGMADMVTCSRGDAGDSV